MQICEDCIWIKIIKATIILKYANITKKVGSNKHGKNVQHRKSSSSGRKDYSGKLGQGI